VSGRIHRTRKTDGNHAQLLNTFRELQLSVHDTHELGGGFGDCVVGVPGVNVLVEIKDDSLPPSKRDLTEDEHEFHRIWRGPLVIVESIDHAIKVAKRMREISHLASVVDIRGRVSEW
jgi:hypothetical protein